MRCRPAAAALGAALLAVLATTGPVRAGVTRAHVAPTAFSGLGAWIDVFEYVPAFVQQFGPPPVQPASVDDLAALGAKTLYLQAAIDDPRAPDLIVNRTLVAAILQRAHARALRVVAWYYPQLVDPTRDSARLDALVSFRAGGERFDGVALDIESAQVADVDARNTALVALAHRLRTKAHNLPIGAIVYPAVQLEVVNPRLWPRFPYRALAPSVDVWLPMTYWTFRSAPYRDAFTYTDESIRRLRSDLHDRGAPVSPVGGLAGDSVPLDYLGFKRAVRQDHAIGASVFDAATTATTAWTYLRTG